MFKNAFIHFLDDIGFSSRQSPSADEPLKPTSKASANREMLAMKMKFLTAVAVLAATTLVAPAAAQIKMGVVGPITVRTRHSVRN